MAHGKGAFVLTSDEKRKDWKVDGPHFAGWEIYHMKGSPVDPNRLYASQTSAWFGQIIQRSDDGGKTWIQPGLAPGEPTTGPDGMPKGDSNKFVYDISPETGQTADDSHVVRRHPASVGVQTGLASRAVADRSESRLCGRGRCRVVRIERRRRELEGARRIARSRHRDRNGNRARAECVCTRLFSIRKIRSECSSPSRRRARFRTDDGGKTWKPINQGLHSQYIPDPKAEVGHCVHHIAMHPSRPNTLFMQKHWDVMRSDDAGDSWHEVSGNLPSDFGFPIDIHAHEPETIYVVPIKSDSEHFPLDGKLRVYRSRTGGNKWEELTKGLPQRDCYVNVLRDAMSVDSLDSCGVYFGTTGGQVYGSNDAGDWNAIVRDLPAVLSVEAQTLK